MVGTPAGLQQNASDINRTNAKMVRTPLEQQRSCLLRRFAQKMAQTPMELQRNTLDTKATSAKMPGTAGQYQRPGHTNRTAQRNWQGYRGENLDTYGTAAQTLGSDCSENCP